MRRRVCPEQHLEKIEATSVPAVPEEFGAILRRADRYSRGVDRVIDPDIDPLGIVLEDLNSPVQARIRGRDTILFGTNSYLGLNFHPDCVGAAVAATERYGTGSTASRVAGGTTHDYLLLEQEIADFYERRSSVVFSTGFMANLGVISSLAQEGDTIFLDAHCHASIIDAAKLSGADTRFFIHNDAGDLERLFAESEIPSSRTLVVVEGVYSVLGDIAELRDILALAKERGAVTIVDEAHSLGVYGNVGRGVTELLRVEDLADIIVGTFSKSIGVVGGFCVTDLNQLRRLKVMARPFLYTASLPPGVVAAARASLGMIAQSSSLKTKLWQNIAHIRKGLQSKGISLSGDGPIGSISLPRSSGYETWNALLAKGIYVNLLIPPATPDGELALRISVSAAHEPDQINRAVDAVSYALIASKLPA